MNEAESPRGIPPFSEPVEEKQTQAGGGGDAGWERLASEGGGGHCGVPHSSHVEKGWRN